MSQPQKPLPLQPGAFIDLDAIDRNVRSKGYTADASVLALNPAEYSRYIKNILPSQDLALQRARAQSGWEQAGHAALQAVGEVVGGAIEGIGATGKLVTAPVDYIRGEQQTFDNALMELGRGIREGIAESNPIYRQRPDVSWDISDPGWWWSNMPSLASSLSMLIPAEGAVAGMSALARLAKLGEVVSPGLKLAAKIGTGAVVSRNAENFREAHEVYQQGYQTVLDELADPRRRQQLRSGDAAREARLYKGQSDLSDEELAGYIAAKGAWRSYQVNAANVVFDAMQFAPLLKNFRTATRNRFGTPLKVLEAQGIAPTMAQKIGAYLNPTLSAVGGMASEGVEEGVNFAGTGEGNALINQLLDKDVPDFGQRMKGYLSDGHFWEAAAWGAGGGGVFEAVGAFAHPDTGPQSVNAKIGEISDRKTILTAFAAQLAQVEKSSLPEEEKMAAVNRVKSEMAFTLGIQAAKAGNVELLLQHLDDPTFKRLHVDLNFFSDKDAGKAIEHTRRDILAAEALYKKHYGLIMTSGLSQAAASAVIRESAQTEYAVEGNKKRLAELDTQIAAITAANPAFADPTLSSAANTRLQYNALKEAMVVAAQQMAHALSRKDTQATEQFAQVGKTLQEKLATLPQESADLTSGYVQDELIARTAERELLAAYTTAQQTYLAKLGTAQGRQQVGDAAQQRATTAAAGDFTRFKAQVDQETDVVTLQTLLANQTDPVRKKLAQDRIAALRKQHADEDAKPARQAIVAAARGQVNAPPVEEVNAPPAGQVAPPPDFAALMAAPPVSVAAPPPNRVTAPPVSAITPPPEEDISAPPKEDILPPFQEDILPPKEDIAGPPPVDVAPPPPEMITPPPAEEPAPPVIEIAPPPVVLHQIVAMNTPPVQGHTPQPQAPKPEPNHGIPASADGVVIALWNDALRNLSGKIKASLANGAHTVPLTPGEEALVRAFQHVEVGGEVTVKRFASRFGNTGWQDYTLGVFVDDVMIGTINELPYLDKQIQRAKQDKKLAHQRVLELNRQQVAALRKNWDTDPQAQLTLRVSKVSGGAVLNTTTPRLAATAFPQMLEISHPGGGIYLATLKDKADQLIKPNTDDVHELRNDSAGSLYNADGAYTPGRLYVLAPGLNGKNVAVPLDYVYLEEHETLRQEAADGLIALAQLMQDQKLSWRDQPVLDTMAELRTILNISNDEGTVRVTDNRIEIPFRQTVPGGSSSPQTATIWFRYKDGTPRTPAIQVGQQSYELTSPLFALKLQQVLGGVKLNVARELLNTAKEFTFAGKTYPSYNHFLADKLTVNVGTLTDAQGRSVSNFSPVQVEKQGYGGMNIVLEPAELPRVQATKQEPNAVQAAPTQPTKSTEPISVSANPSLPTRSGAKDRQPGIGRVRMLKTDDTLLKVQQQDIAQARNWWQKNFPYVPFKEVEGLIHNGGELAFGLFADASVTLSSLAVQGTHYHEAFHVAMHLYSSEEKRQAIYAEARKTYGELNDYALEEKLAEEFRAWMITRQTEREKDSAIVRFFRRLKEWISALLRKPSLTKQLFRDINTGAFAIAPTPQMIAYAKGIKAAKPVPGFTSVQENEILSAMTNLSYGGLQELKNGDEVWREFRADYDTDEAAIRQWMIDQLYDFKDEKGPEFESNFIKVLQAFNDYEGLPGLWQKTKNKLNQYYGIDVDTLNLSKDWGKTDANGDPLNEEDIALQQKDWEASALTSNGKDTVSAQIKHLIRSTPKLEAFDVQGFKRSGNADDHAVRTKSTLLGINVFLDFDEVYPFLENALSGVTSTEDMMDRLERYTESWDASLGYIYADLHADENLRAAFYHQFHKQTPDIWMPSFHVNDKHQLELSMMLVNRNRAAFTIAADLENAFKLHVSSGQLNPEELTRKLDRVRRARKELDKTVTEETIREAARALSLTYKELGITLMEAGTDILEKAFQGELRRHGMKAMRQIHPDLQMMAESALAGKETNETGNFRRLGEIVQYYKKGTLQNVAQNVEGKNIYSVTLPNFLSNFMDELKNPANRQALRHKLSVYLTDPRMQYSNWMRQFVKTDRNGSFLRDEAGLPILNETGLEQFNYALLDGLKNMTSGEGRGYTAMDESDYDLMAMTMFLRSSNNIKDYRAMFPMHIPSDAGTLYTLTMPRLSSWRKNGNPSELDNALLNLVYQEMAAMKAARAYLFEPGTTTPKADVKAQKFYHTDGKGNLVKDGKAAGGVFRFQTFPALNELDLFDEHGFLREDDTLVDLHGAAINQAIQDAVNREATKIAARMDGLLKQVDADSARLTTGDEGNRQRAYYEFASNHIVFNVEYMQWLHGNASEYKPSTDNVDSNKRAKWVMAPGSGLATEVAGASFRAVTLTDVERPSSILPQLVASMAAQLASRHEGLRLRDGFAQAIVGGKPADLNALEADVYEIAQPYTAINTADAQGYMTLSRMEKIIRGRGQWTPRWAALLEKARRGDELSPKEVSDMGTYLQVEKPFYGARQYDAEQGRMVTNMIKYASVPLLPAFTRGTDLDRLRQWMEDHSVDEVFYESAHKVGIIEAQQNGKVKPTALHTAQYQLDAGKLEQMRQNIRTYDNRYWQIQLDVPQHLVDESNKLGTQIAALIVGNLSPTATYTLAGKPMSARQLQDDYFATLESYVNEEFDNLMQELGATVTDGEIVLGDLSKFEDLLQRELDSRDTSSTIKDLAKRGADGKFRVPLYYSASADKFQAILTSLFTNRIVNLRAPGASAVQVSSAFLEQQPDQGGITYLRDVQTRGDYKLRGAYLKNGKLQPAEILLPNHLSKYFGASINDIDPRMLEMIGYRIPTEKKSSMVPLRVVGFLPPEMGSTIVVPDEFVVQMGSDFDVDKLFLMYRNPGRNLTGRQALQNRILDTFWSVLSHPDHFLEMVAPQGFEQFREVAAELRAISSSGDALNPAYYTAQTEYRKRNTVGRALKGLAADANKFGAVAQVARMELSDAVAPVMLISESEANLEELRARYGDDVLEEVVGKSGKRALLIRFKRLGWALDGSHQNAAGEMTLDVCSQGVAAAVDIVKDPTFDAFNGNVYTYHVLHTMMLAGIPFRTAALFVAQPVIRELAGVNARSKGVLGDGSSAEIAQVKNDLLNKLKPLGVVLKDKDLAKRVKQEGVSYQQALQEALSPAVQQRYQFQGFYAARLKSNVQTRAALDQGKTVETDRLRAYYLDQLIALEHFRNYKDAAQALQDGIKVFKTDKLGAGPSTDVTGNLLFVMDRVTRNRNLLIDQDGEKLPAPVAVYPALYGSDKPSVYAPLQAYLQKANLASRQLIGGLFIHESPAGQQYLENIRQRITPTRYDVEVMGKARRMLTTLVMSRLPFLAETDTARVMGLGEWTRVELPLSPEAFGRMSAARKLNYVKSKLLPQLQQTDPAQAAVIEPLLTKLTAQLHPDAIARNEGVHVIDFENVADRAIDEDLTDSFDALFDSEDLMLSALADDLIRYSFLSKGMAFTRSSFAKLFSERVLNHPRIGLGDHLNQVLRRAQNRDYFQTEFGDGALKLAQMSWNDKSIVPTAPRNSGAPNAPTHVSYHADGAALSGWASKKVGEFFLRTTRRKNPKASQPGQAATLVTGQTLYQRAVELEGGKWLYLPVTRLGIPGKLVETGEQSVIAARNEAAPSVEPSLSRMEYNEQEDQHITGRKVAFLTEAFAQAGVKVLVVEDGSIQGNAQIATENNQPVIRINPDKVFADTVIHEFGHLYVDLLGENHELIQEGIAQLRDTDLYRKVQAAYPELSGIALDKEVLVTAIGREGARIFQDRALNKWQIWLNRFFRAVGRLFGIEPGAARLLAEKLVAGKLGRNLEGKLSGYVQQQKSTDDEVDAFLGSEVVALEKRIQKFRQNTDYAGQLTELVEAIKGSTHHDAIRNLTAYVRNTVNALEKGLDRWEAEDPTRLSSNPERMQMERRLADFLHNANVIVQSFKSFEQLSFRGKTDPAVQFAIADLKAELPLVAELDRQIKRMSESMYRRRLMEYTSNPDLVEKLVDLFDARSTKYFSAEDESLTQRTLDAMSDTNNSFLALVLKEYELAQELNRNETTRRKARFAAMVEEMKGKGISLSDFLERDAAGTPTGRLLSEYDFSGWEASRRQMQQEMLQNPDREKSIRIGWENANQRSNPAIIAQGRELLKTHSQDSETYLAWKKQHYTYSERFKKWYPKRQTLVPGDSWKSSAYARLEANPEAFGYFEQVRDLLSELVSHTNYNLVKAGFIPAVPLDERSYWEAIKQEMGMRKDNRESAEEEDVLVDENGNIISFIPFHYLRKLNQTEKLTVPEGATAEEIQAIKRRNLEIEEQNALAHARAVNHNLEETIPAFMDTAMNHKFKKGMEASILLAKEQLAGMAFERSRGLSDRVASALHGEKKPVTVSGEQTNAYKHFEDWIRMVFYEDFEHGDSSEKFVSALRSAQNFLSFSAIGFNLFSGVSNKLYGETMLLTEAAGAQFFSGADYARATKEVDQVALRMLAHGDDPNATSKVEAALKHFDLLQSQDELSGKQGGAIRSKLHRLKFVSNLAYALQHLGEYTMQNKALLAMMHHQKVVKDGQEISLMDAVEFRDGVMQLPQGLTTADGKAFDELMLANFRRKVIGVNQYLHGIYNQEDAGTIQKYALGRLAMQFRKWARPGWNKRFGTKFGKAFWNERREMLDEGMYVTAAKFATRLLKDYQHMLTNAKVLWSQLDQTQRANIRRTALELSFMVSIAIVAEMLAAELGDDDEDGKLLAFSGYMASRLRSEMLTYTPIYGWFNEGKKLLQSPVPLMRPMELSAKVLWNMFLFPFRDEEERTFEGGQYYGEDKVATYLTQLLPFINQVQRVQFLEKNTSYYSLF